MDLLCTFEQSHKNPITAGIFSATNKSSIIKFREELHCKCRWSFGMQLEACEFRWKNVNNLSVPKALPGQREFGKWASQEFMIYELCESFQDVDSDTRLFVHERCAIDFCGTSPGSSEFQLCRFCPKGCLFAFARSSLLSPNKPD